MNDSIIYDVHSGTDEYEVWFTSTGRTVLSLDGEWKADLSLGGMPTEEEVRRELVARTNLVEDNIVSIEACGYTDGSPESWLYSSDCWRVEVDRVITVTDPLPQVAGSWERPDADAWVARKEFADEIYARFEATTADGDVKAEIVVYDRGDEYTTSDTEDWDDVERYVPRSEWPDVIYAGKRTGTYRPHTKVDPLLTTLIDEVRAQLAKDTEDDEV